MKRATRAFQRRSGFSLLELMAVISVIFFIASIIVPRVTETVGTSKEKTCFHNRAQINMAVELYGIEHGELPETIADLDTPDRFPDGIPRCPVSNVPYQLNPTTRRVQGHLGGGKTGGHP